MLFPISLALHETLTAELVYRLTQRTRFFIADVLTRTSRRYNASRVRTSVICPMKVYTQLGDALVDSDIQLSVPSTSISLLADASSAASTPLSRPPG